MGSGDLVLKPVAAGDRAAANRAYRRLAHAYALRIATWVLELLVSGNTGDVHPSWTEVVARHIGMELDSNPDTRVTAVLGRARERLEEFEAKQMTRAAPLYRNLDRLAPRFGFDAVGKEVLLVLLLSRVNEFLRRAGDMMMLLDRIRLTEVLAVATGASFQEVELVLRRGGTLLSSGLVFLDNRPELISRKLGLRAGLTETMLAEHAESEDVASWFANRSAPATLERAAFVHLEAEVELLVQYLAEPSAGIGRNILLYGPPGTGKTELARLATRLAGLDMYEGEVAGPDGEPLDVAGRLMDLTLLQRLVGATGHAAILFDEVEDVFKPQDGPDPQNRGVAAGDSKGWTVRLLENNLATTIWISNRVEHIDPAVLRRFDLVFEIPIPPLGVRKAVLAHHLGAAFDERSELGQVLLKAAPAPALLTRAAAVIRNFTEADSPDRKRRFEVLLRGYLKALGHDLRYCWAPAEDDFEPLWVNSSPDYESTIGAAKSDQNARLLIWGRSGTGKTVFARHIGCALECPVYMATTMDLVGLMQGASEHRIETLFRRATADGAVLILDNVDWLLRAWPEERAKEELRLLDCLSSLLDSHPGRVLATLTGTYGVEAGMLRRFPWRVSLGGLTRAQGTRMIAELCSRRLGVPRSDLNTRLQSEIGGLDGLTPGDVISAFRGFASCEPSRLIQGVAAALRSATVLKCGGAERSIGFLASPTIV